MASKENTEIAKEKRAVADLGTKGSSAGEADDAALCDAWLQKQGATCRVILWDLPAAAQMAAE